MIDEGGFIPLHRNFLTWQWYKDKNVKTVFLHCILKANWEDKSWQGKVIKKGSFVTSRAKLAEETTLTEQQVRTSLNKLKSTNDITIETTNKNTVISIVSYDKWQLNNQVPNHQITNKQPSNNQQITTTNKIIIQQVKKNIDKDIDKSTFVQLEKLHYITQRLFNKNLLFENDHIEVFDSIICESLDNYNSVDVVIKAEYVLTKMKDNNSIDNRVAYFQKSLIDNLVGDKVAKESLERSSNEFIELLNTT